MNPIQSRLQAHTPLILDGALATELERKGCDLNDSLWSAKILIEQPELIQQVHLDYFQQVLTVQQQPATKRQLMALLKKATQKKKPSINETICHVSKRSMRAVLAG